MIFNDLNSTSGNTMVKSYKLFKLLTPSYIVFKCNPFFLTVTSNRKKSHSGNEYEEIYSQERRK